MITDHNIGWVRKKKFYTIGDLFTGLTTPATGTITQGEAIQSAAGTVGDSPEIFLGELSTFGLSGLQFTGNLTSLLQVLIRPPCDLDPTKSVGFRFNWSGSAAASAGRGVTFAPLFVAKKKGDTLVTVATPATALDTVIGNSLNTGALANEWTPRGIKNNFFATTKEQIEDGVMLQMVINATLNSSPGTIILWGCEMDYAVWACQGSGPFVDQPQRANSASGL